jgi:hypothetical protein
VKGFFCAVHGLAWKGGNSRACENGLPPTRFCEKKPFLEYVALRRWV